MTTWVLLRGLAREGRHWGKLPARLQERVPAGDEVITMDLPGTGLCWRERSPLTVAEMARALRCDLRVSGHRPPYIVIALSLGAMTALQWAAEAPQELRGFVLINGSLGTLSPFWERLRPAAWPALLRWIAARSREAREQAVFDATSNRPLDREVFQGWIRCARKSPVSKLNAVRQLVAASRFRVPAQLPVPALVVTTAGDRLVSHRCSQAIARHWQLPLREHPDAGHDLPLDEPAWLLDTILQWRAEAFQMRATQKVFSTAVPSTAMSPPSSRVITMVAERGRALAPPAP